jgi:hypothetical protein
VKHYAWEAAHLGGRRPVVHAVSVIDGHSRDGDIRRGDRNTESCCRRRIGQRSTRYRGGRVAPDLQLHRAGELAHLERCRSCLAELGQRWYRENDSVPELWDGDLPDFPGTPLFQIEECATPWPTYYRYLPGREVGEQGLHWLPAADWPAETRMVHAADVLVELGLVDRGQVPLGGGTGPNQARIAERRRAEMSAHLEALAGGDAAVEAAHRRSMELLAEVVGTAAMDELAEHGHLDVPSRISGRAAYRLRPWRRIGLLERAADGWEELRRSLCVHPDELYPMSDELLTLWLTIRFDEPGLLALANVHGTAA